MKNDIDFDYKLNQSIESLIDHLANDQVSKNRNHGNSNGALEKGGLWRTFGIGLGRLMVQNDSSEKLKESAPHAFRSLVFLEENERMTYSCDKGFITF